MLRMASATLTLLERDPEATEAAQLRRRVAVLEESLELAEARLARRVALDDATICAGYRRYEMGPETPVMTLVGHPLRGAKKPWWKLW